MKKVKLFVGESYTMNEDEYVKRIKKDLQDWVELSDEEYANLIIYKTSIESSLRNKGMIGWNEQLIILRESSEEEVNEVKVNLKAIIDTIAKQAKARAEKEKKRYEKMQKDAEDKKKKKELAQLKKLQEKYGEISESSK